jgi:hypothetical protein
MIAYETSLVKGALLSGNAGLVKLCPDRYSPLLRKGGQLRYQPAYRSDQRPRGLFG